MSHPEVDLKNRWIAAALAYLIPGAGHFYQRRYFKAAIYFFCIMGIFSFGLCLGEGKVVYSRLKARRGKTRTIGYLSQVLVGLPALPANVQTMRYDASSDDEFGFDPDRNLSTLETPIEAEFSGKAVYFDDESLGEEELSGRVMLAPSSEDAFDREVQGRFVGEAGDQQPIEFKLAGPIEIGPEIYASEHRYLQCRIIKVLGDHEQEVGYIEGTVPRKFWNWFQVPLEDAELQTLHGKLGKFFELAQVFTWIAGLLNLLAIWDALEGPAYGLGDEEESDNKDDKESESDASVLRPEEARLTAESVERT